MNPQVPIKCETKNNINFGSIIALQVIGNIATSNVASNLWKKNLKIRNYVYIQLIYLRDPLQIKHTAMENRSQFPTIAECYSGGWKERTAPTLVFKCHTALPILGISSSQVSRTKMYTNFEEFQGLGRV